MDTWDCVRTRLEIREYRPDPVPEEIVQRVVEAGRLGPSARNRQPWHFIVVRNKATLKKMAPLCTTGPYIEHAAFAVVIVTDPARPTRIVDGARAAQGMMLTAWEAGVGSCWVSNLEQDHLKTLLGIPKEYEILVAIPFGYPAKAMGKGVKNRKPASEVVHWERFGQHA